MTAAAFLAGLGCGFVLTCAAWIAGIWWVFRDWDNHHNGA